MLEASNVSEETQEMLEASKVSQEMLQAPEFSEEMLDLFTTITYMISVLGNASDIEHVESFVKLIETSVETLSKILSSPAFPELTATDPGAIMVFIAQILTFLKGAVYALDLLIADASFDVEKLQSVRQSALDIVESHKGHSGFNPEMSDEEISAVKDKIAKWKSS